jgi:bifunctional oligoribonuclease and PAP phosphatase NrnA
MTLNQTTPTVIGKMHYAEAADAIAAADSILIVTHINPDGDAIGSLLGLGLALRERFPHKSIDLAVDGGVPDYLQFLPDADTVLPSLNDENAAWDLMISVDASDEPRTGEVGAFGRAHSPRVVNLDHHATNTSFGQFYLVNPSAVSATEVVFDWLTTLDWTISRTAAVSLLCGLVTDTLGFRTSNVTARTLEIAQKLMMTGASLTAITQRALDTMPYAVLNLWKAVFNSIELENGLIWAVVTQADVHRVGAEEVTDSGLSTFLIKVDEAMISAVFKEQPNGSVELSFRSKPGYNVAQVALSLGGGGHKQASGATIPGPLSEATSRVLPLLREAVQTGALFIQ